MELRHERKPTQERGGEEPRSEDRTRLLVDDALRCKRCGNELSSQRLVFAMAGSTAVQAFPNPYGEMKEILTVKRAWSVAVEAWATTDFTWFQGYAWRIASCGQCRAHVGWRFDAVEGNAEPPSFFGLLVAALSR